MKNSHLKNLKIILSSRLNTSKSKAAYSFGKQIRFKIIFKKIIIIHFIIFHQQ